ncbi:hypothetical protein VPH35_111338 [Triticum aestivum]
MAPPTSRRPSSIYACSLALPRRRREGHLPLPRRRRGPMRRKAEAVVAPLVGDYGAVLRLLRAHADNRRHGAEFKVPSPIDVFGSFSNAYLVPVFHFRRRHYISTLIEMSWQ